MGKNIVLIGFMGTGKSSVGMKLAERLKLKFVDMDREIEKVCGMSVSDVFRRYGEVRFRSEERLMAGKLAGQTGLVIATGGGVILGDGNLEALQGNGIIINLEAKPEYIFQRVNRKKGTRPLLKKNVTVEDIKEMLQHRQPLYQQAEIIIDTNDKGVDEVVEEIISFLRVRGELSGRQEAGE
ncbi:MAG: shikimate kinase [Syntrophomonadaceae bacterium]|nr:shikimate kinase [Syntrophomonadaceae bacterium]